MGARIRLRALCATLCVAPLRAFALVGATTPSTGWNAAFAVLSLTAVAGGWWAWKRRVGLRRPRTGRRGATAIVRLASQALTPQASVHAVEWNGEAYLLACTPQQVILLSHKAAAQGAGEEP